MTDSTGRQVRITPIDFGKIFLAVLVAASIPIASGFAAVWRDVALLQNNREHDVASVRALRGEVLELKREIRDTLTQINLKLDGRQQATGR